MLWDPDLISIYEVWGTGEESTKSGTVLQVFSCENKDFHEFRPPKSAQKLPRLRKLTRRPQKGHINGQCPFLSLHSSAARWRLFVFFSQLWFTIRSRGTRVIAGVKIFVGCLLRTISWTEVIKTIHQHESNYAPTASECKPNRLDDLLCNWCYHRLFESCVPVDSHKAGSLLSSSCSNIAHRINASGTSKCSQEISAQSLTKRRKTPFQKNSNR